VGEKSIDRSLKNLQTTSPLELITIIISAANAHSDPLVSFPPAESHEASTIQGTGTIPLNTLPYIITSPQGRLLRIKDPGTPGAPYFNRINVTAFLNRFKTTYKASDLEIETVFEILLKYYTVFIGLLIRTILKWEQLDWDGLYI
jgi:hypothetical protein